jgi:hypothetical protein
MSQDSEYGVQLSPGSILSMLHFLPPSPFPPMGEGEGVRRWGVRARRWGEGRRGEGETRRG